MSDRMPYRFRAFLREELPRWRAEGLVDERSAEALAQRYLAEPEGTGLALAAIYVLAACLVGAGVISLVAWHWDELPRGLRLGMLGSALVAAHLAGYRMWKVQARRPLLGHAVSLLGTILFGASIGLVAQIFHVSGVWYGAFGAWALGALAAAVILPGLPELGLATILGLFVWGPGFVSDHPQFADAAAWAVGALALVLAFRSRSRVLFLLSTGGLATVLAAAAMTRPHDRSADMLGPVLAVAAATCAFAALAPKGAPHRFAAAASWLGRIALLVFAYWLSFEWSAREALRGGEWTRLWATCVVAPLVAAAALLAVANASAPGAWPRRAEAWIATAFAAFYAAAVPLELAHIPLAVAANVAVVGIGAIQIAEGLQSRRRAPFWDGLAVVAIAACSRFFEIDSLLWLKGLGFIACGAGVIVAALLFEKRLQRGAEVRDA
jgi:uncharacterized membrane protein